LLGRCFGGGVLILGLAAICAVPVIQFLSLGYLLEAARRTASTGRLRDGLPGVNVAQRLGLLFCVVAPVAALLYVAARLLGEAELIDPASVSIRWLLELVRATTTLVAIQAALIWLRATSPLKFYLPGDNWRWLAQQWRQGMLLSAIGHALRLRYYELHLTRLFRLGVISFVGAALWLAIPSLMLFYGPRHAGLAWGGGALLTLAVVLLPYLQLRTAIVDRLSAIGDWSAAWGIARRAPVAYLASQATLLTLAIALYTLKVVELPSDAAWLLGLPFVLFLLPARLLTARAYYRGLHAPRPAPKVIAWPCVVAALVLAAAYAALVYYERLFGYLGAWGIFKQHAFLLPSPF
jgi:hypothetical protein